jgi:CBS domain containing-hemolysin-like protein
MLQLFAAIALVLINGFFVAAEFAFVKIRATQLEPLSRKGSRRAKQSEKILEQLDPYLSACQLGVTLASLALGWVGEPVVSTLLEPMFGWIGAANAPWRHGVSVAIGFTIITFAHIVLGEQVPKFIAIKRVVPTSLWTALPLYLFFRASYPFIWVLNFTSIWVLKRVGIEPENAHGGEHTEEELRLMLGSSLSGRETSPLSRDIVLNALDLPHRTVREVMKPRRDIVLLNTSDSIADCLATAEQMRYSRYPLCEKGDLDQAIGILHTKDLFSARNRAKIAADLRPYARKIIYVPESAHLAKLLHRFLERKSHLALVIDEYGTTVGIVTLENILEELVGQIQDEFDHEKARVERVNENEWMLDGTLPLFEVAEIAQETIEAAGSSTISGWMTEQLGGFPKVGASVYQGNVELRVLELDGLRVSKLLMKRTPPKADQDTEIIKPAES